MSELFEKKNWIGEFWWEDKYENRFSGEIDYSFGNIINLSYFINFNSRSKLPVESNTISGEIATEKGIKKCTLVGKLILPSQQYGSFRGEASFSFLIIGKHLKHDELFHNLSFKLTGMQEFFSTGSNDNAKILDKPLFTAKTKYCQIEITNITTLSSMVRTENISSIIYSDNNKINKELDQLFSNIKSKYPKERFWHRKNIEYRIYLQLNSENKIFSIHKNILNIANLFSILMKTPVYPYCIEDTDKHIKIYPSILLEPGTLYLIKQYLKNKRHDLMPITNDKIKLKGLIEKWFNPLFIDDFVRDSIVKSIQTQTILHNEFSLYSEVVVYATLLESINNIENPNKTEKEKYDYTINKYGTIKIQNKIKGIFTQDSKESIGKKIGELRNEIAHVKRERELLQKLSKRDISKLCYYLQLTILGYILKNLGIDKAIITSYQDIR